MLNDQKSWVGSRVRLDAVEWRKALAVIEHRSSIPEPIAIPADNNNNNNNSSNNNNNNNNNKC
jgi:hypothetical protein